MPDIPNIGQTAFATPQANRQVASYRTPEVPESALTPVSRILSETDKRQEQYDLAQRKFDFLKQNLALQDQIKQDPNYLQHTQDYQQKIGNLSSAMSQGLSAEAAKEFSLYTQEQGLKGFYDLKDNAEKIDNSVKIAQNDQQRQDASAIYAQTGNSDALKAAQDANVALANIGKKPMSVALKENSELVSYSAALRLQQNPTETAKLFTHAEQQVKSDISNTNVPLNVRNNNPGNIKDSQGNFKIFDSPEAGQEAMRQDLMTKVSGNSKAMEANFGKGYKPTLFNLISTWAPASDNNDPEKYAETVSKDTGIGRDQVLTPADVEKLIPAMTKVEGGGAAVGSSSNNPIVKPTGNPDFDFLRAHDPEKFMQLKSWADGQRGVFRQDLEDRAKDNIAMLQQNGASSEPAPSKDDFDVAYGPESQRKYKEFTDNQVFSQAYHVASLSSSADQAKMLLTMKPDPGPDFAEKQVKYQKMSEALAASNKSREDDPLGFAFSKGLSPQTPLDFKDPENLALGINNRQKLSLNMKDKFGTPNALFTSGEVTSIATTFGGLPAEKKLSLLKSIHMGATDPGVFSAGMAQLRPNSPMTAMAGSYVDLPGNKDIGNGDQVAQKILYGEQLLNPPMKEGSTEKQKSRIDMPNESDLRTAFFSDYQEALAQTPQLAEDAFQAFKAYYAAEAANNGSYDNKTINTDFSDKAKKAIIGDTYDSGNSNVVVPWGMNSSDFGDKAQAEYNKKIESLNLDQDEFNFRKMKLINGKGFGEYFVQNGADYLRDKNGQPLTLSIRQ